MIRYHTSESVTEGHPDKVCDRISDSILDSILGCDPEARVACEAMAATGYILVSGQITTHCYVDIPSIVRNCLEEIGYTRAKYGFDARTCGVLTSLEEQSPDIAMGVFNALEHSEDPKDPLDKIGAGDQGMMYGFACDETDTYMPLAIDLAHQLTRRLAKVRKEGILSYVRPDGKAQVSVQYEDHIPKKVTGIVVSTQHSPLIETEDLRKDILEHVIRPIIPENLMDDDTKIYINPTGRFVIGGPMGDVGLTGRKIIVDTYGGYAKHGGGAFSGKDATKVDRSAAYAARHIAKNIVGAQLAKRCEISLSYAIGVARPTSIDINCFGTETQDIETIRKKVQQHFDCRPAAIIERFQLKRPIYTPLSSYGHFGRRDLKLPWEELDVVERLK
ncbi:MAG: methionine adenosyltransferase [Tissierellia bacterium]|nr:methionine adenosyltransferase [Tissierellia bacterium]